MSSSEGESNSNAPSPASSLVPLEFQSNEDKTPTEKMKVIVQDDGSVVGEYAKVWNSRSGDYVREHIPISYTNWRRVPRNLKDNVWNALMVNILVGLLHFICFILRVHLIKNLESD